MRFKMKVGWAILETVPDPMYMAKSKLRRSPKDKKSGLPKKYVPKSLSQSDRKKQLKSLRSKTNAPRPQVGSFKSKRSPWVVKFEKKYKHKITDDAFISKNIISREGIKQILAKGRGAYKSGGSRPNQNPTSWARARLASVILGGKARTVDQKIWNKYKVQSKK